MANEETTAAPEQAVQPQFAIERIYIKDLSLECPKGVAAFGKAWKPKMDLDLNNSQDKVAEDLYEVVLSLTVKATDAESGDTVYLVEVQQAGTFRAAGIPETDLRRLLATMAPSTLFPYARETIDGLVTKAGFAPVRLAPINFDALLAQAVQKHQAAEAGAGAAAETEQ